MTSSFDYTKLIVENLKSIVPLVLLVFTTLTTTLGYNVIDNIDKGIEIEAAREQLIEIANYYVEAEIIKPKEIVKPIIKNNCGSCKTLLLEHKREFHQ